MTTSRKCPSQKWEIMKLHYLPFLEEMPLLSMPQVVSTSIHTVPYHSLVLTDMHMHMCMYMHMCMCM